MSRSTSFFLDLLRLLAAGAVFAAHCVLFWSPRQAEGLAGTLGHRAVVVFFVLSGYVIAYSTLKKTPNVREYVAARLSRLYSVVLPALILTAVLQVVGTHFNPGFYAHFQRGHDAMRYLLSLFFLQSLWTSNFAPPTNGPLWSLGYEFWYYAIFGAAVFVRRLRWKYLWVVALLLISGIDSFLLMPAWIFGVLLYLYGGRGTVSKTWALGGAMLALAATVTAILTLPNWPAHFGSAPFFFSSAFLTDGLIGLMLAALIALVDQAFASSDVPERLDAVVRWTADHTFSLYLYHFPLLLFITAVVPFNHSDPTAMACVIALVLFLVLLLSWMTEAPRARWREFFRRCWDWAALRLSRKAVIPTARA